MTKKPKVLKMDKRLQIVLSEEHLQLIDDWRRKEPDIPGRSEAVRRMIEKAAKGK